ncbi:hypothetical protein [Fluviicola sp.]|uniref:hypothetical protein n=1 Tax=Fluviicola sp. TaxID=1917219 RepID=UPI0026237244|nr:hypothetical protein [Fluviicola sp.]
MKLGIILAILSVQSVCAQNTFRASFGIHSPHSYLFEQDGSYQEIFAGKNTDAIVKGTYELKNNRIIFYYEYDGFFIPENEFVLSKDSSIIDVETLNSYPISTSGKIGLERRLDLLRNENLNNQLDLQAKVVENDSLNDWTDSKTIEATLVNKSTDTLRVLEMTCAYENFFTTDSQENKVQSSHLCYRDLPGILKIPPHESKSYKFYVKKSAAGREKMFRIGLYALTPNEYLSERDLINHHYKNRKLGELIWSNVIRM